MEALYGVMNIVGPLLLGLVLLWVMLRNKKRTKAEKDATERATRELYNEPDGPDSGMKH